MEWIVVGGVIVGAIMFARRSRSRTVSGSDTATPLETETWRERSRGTYVTGQGILGELTVEAIASCEPDNAGEVRRAWLEDAIKRARKASQTASALSAEATTSNGRHASDMMASAMVELAEAAAAMLEEPGVVGAEQRLTNARASTRASLTVIRAVT
ncbi:hypothetical protein [Acrocarpospora macrocephala]|uniref:hypothetical protein n=1 Tax=Acrocarpospora macrocephala TaxID=150177 RepID=UPI0012D34CC3|nr:hypothetical protein [Acrocarpospora macrocephala]